MAFAVVRCPLLGVGRHDLCRAIEGARYAGGDQRLQVGQGPLRVLRCEAAQPIELRQAVVALDEAKRHRMLELGACRLHVGLVAQAPEQDVRVVQCGPPISQLRSPPCIGRRAGLVGRHADAVGGEKGSVCLGKGMAGVRQGQQGVDGILRDGLSLQLRLGLGDHRAKIGGRGLIIGHGLIEERQCRLSIGGGAEAPIKAPGVEWNGRRHTVIHTLAQAPQNVFR